MRELKELLTKRRLAELETELDAEKEHTAQLLDERHKAVSQATRAMRDLRQVLQSDFGRQMAKAQRMLRRDN